MAGKINATVLAAVLQVVVVVAMMITSSFIMTAEARFDLSSIVGYMGINEAETTSFQVPESTTKEACCDSCICAYSLPPQCQCTDIKPYCHSKCKMCICTKSIPPQCRCLDIDDFCYPTCCSSSSSSSSNDAAAAAAAAAFINGIAN